MKASLVLLFLVIGISAQIKKPEPPAVKTPFAESLQAIVVTTDAWSETTGDAELYERKDLKSKWKAVGKEFEIVVGRTGLAWAQDSAPEAASTFKKEGDGKSPAGMFPLTFAFGKADAITSKLSYRKPPDHTPA